MANNNDAAANGGGSSAHPGTSGGSPAPPRYGGRPSLDPHSNNNTSILNNPGRLSYGSAATALQGARLSYGTSATTTTPGGQQQSVLSPPSTSSTDNNVQNNVNQCDFLGKLMFMFFWLWIELCTNAYPYSYCVLFATIT